MRLKFDQSIFSCVIKSLVDGAQRGPEEYFDEQEAMQIIHSVLKNNPHVYFQPAAVEEKQSATVEEIPADAVDERESNVLQQAPAKL